MITEAEKKTLIAKAETLLRKIESLKGIKRERDYKADAKSIGFEANELQKDLFPESYFLEEDRIFRPEDFPRDKDLGPIFRDKEPRVRDFVIEHLDSWKKRVEKFLHDLEQNVASIVILDRKKINALERLDQLIYVAHNQDKNLLDDIEVLGHTANNAVLSLGLPNDNLPLPYNIPRASTGRGALTDFTAMERICKNARAWIQKILIHSPSQSNIFRKEGEIWKIVFKGKSLHFKHSKGLEYIAQLLSKPEKTFSAIQLANIANCADSSNPQEIIDYKALENYKKRLNQISEEIRRAKANNDQAELARLEKERERVNAEINSDMKPDGRLRAFANDSERIRQSVKKAISRSIQKIKSIDTSLGKHLEKSIQTGKTLRYSPTEPTNWQID